MHALTKTADRNELVAINRLDLLVFNRLRVVSALVLETPVCHTKIRNQVLSNELVKESKMSKLARFMKDESGATAIEYGLIAAATGQALVATMPLIEANLTSTFSSIAHPKMLHLVFTTFIKRSFSSSL